jgi:hypothetical protein
MYHITLSKEIKQNCPEFRGAAVFAEVTNTPYCEGLWQEIATFTQELRARETTDSIKYQPVIAATREAYKQGPQPLPSLGRSTETATAARIGTLSDRYVGRPYQPCLPTYGPLYRRI